MKRIYRTTKLQCGATQLEVRQVLGRGESTNPPKVAQALQTSRQWLRDALPFLHAHIDDRTRSAFKHCFRKDPDSASLNTVRAVISNISAGLNQPKLGIKVLADDDALGYVQRYYNGRVHTTFGALFYDASGDAIAHRGEIHLATDVLNDPDVAAVTLIHEAAHKFSNLRDHGNQGYFDGKCRNYMTPGLQWQQALMNADSHAVFVYYLARRLNRINARIANRRDDALDGMADLFA